MPWAHGIFFFRCFFLLPRTVFSFPFVPFCFFVFFVRRMPVILRDARDAESWLRCEGKEVRVRRGDRARGRGGVWGRGLWGGEPIFCCLKSFDR